MGSHSYLQNLETNIHSLQTAGLLNSHANAHTTTNVGHMVGGYTSVIDLSELQLIHFSDASIAKQEALADKVRDAAFTRIDASNMEDMNKNFATFAAVQADKKIHAWLESHRDE